MARKEGWGERALETGALGAAGGALQGYLARSGNPLRRGPGAMALIGGGLGASSQLLGDALLGVPEEEGDSWGEFGRGALGGAITGAVANPLLVGTQKGGASLLHYLMQKGLSKNKAMALLMGSATLGGATLGGASRGLDSSIMHGGESD